MCVICRQNPCNNKCPNYDDKVIGIYIAVAEKINPENVAPVLQMGVKKL